MHFFVVSGILKKFMKKWNFKMQRNNINIYSNFYLNRLFYRKREWMGQKLNVTFWYGCGLVGCVRKCRDFRNWLLWKFTFRWLKLEFSYGWVSITGFHKVPYKQTHRLWTVPFTMKPTNKPRRQKQSTWSPTISAISWF